MVTMANSASIFFSSLIDFRVTLCRDDLAAHKPAHLSEGAAAHYAYGRLLRPSVGLASRPNLNCDQVDRGNARLSAWAQSWSWCRLLQVLLAENLRPAHYCARHFYSLPSSRSTSSSGVRLKMRMQLSMYRNRSF